MSDIAVGTLRDCVVALEQNDRQLAYVSILRDQRIDQMEKKIDRLCLEFIVRHQPAGAHLRFAYAALQINLQLERIGDYAESVARQIIKLLDLKFALPAGLFADITAASISMLRNAITAFVRQDADLAAATAQIEEKVDVLQTQVNSEVLHLVQSNQIPLATLTPLMTIARRFERVSDQAKSMCQETIYLCTGEYAKHQGSQRFRILFLDEDHGCLSQLAQAIGNSLGYDEFDFASAGLQPRPLDHPFLEFAKEKGLALPAQKPNRVTAVADLQDFQVVVALSRTAHRQMPPTPRKTVLLEWFVTDPCSLSSSSSEFRPACEEAYRVLSDQLTTLTRAILTEERTPT